MFHSLFQPDTWNDLLKKESIEKIEKRECPFLKSELLSEDCYILIGRHGVSNKKNSHYIVMSTTTTSFTVQAGYLRCSEKFYKQTKFIDTVLSYLVNIGIGILILGFIMFCSAQFFEFNMHKYLPFDVMYFGFLWMFTLGGAPLVSFIRKLYRERLSKKVVRRIQGLSKLGMPKHAGLGYSLLCFRIPNTIAS